jgi:hypothetical protein
MRNQKGFLIGFILLFIPLTMGLLMTALNLKAYLNPNQATLHTCRTGLLRVQELAAHSMQKLFALNAQVLTLRADRSLAEIALEAAAASLNPAAISAAEAQLQVVIAAQNALRAEQQILLKTSTLSIRQALQESHRELIQELQQQEQNLRPASHFFEFKPGNASHSEYQKLAVRAKKSSAAGPPEYEVSPELTTDQKVSLSWSFELQRKGVKGAPWKSQSLQKSDQCSASLVQDPDQTLRPVLMADRS